MQKKHLIQYIYSWFKKLEIEGYLLSLTKSTYVNHCIYWWKDESLTKI